MTKSAGMQLCMLCSAFGVLGGRSVAPIWRDNVELMGKAAWGRICGCAKLLAGTLRCLRLLLTSSFELSYRPTVGALPQTPQGTLSLDPARGRRKGTKSPLDPISRFSWSHFHAPSACSFLVLRLSPYLLPKLSVKNQKTCLQNAADCAKMPKHPHFSEDFA